MLGGGIDRAIILLMHGDEDDEINGYFLKTAFPQEEEVKQVLKALKVNVDVTLWELLRRINISKTKLERVIEHLVTAGIVTRSEGVIRRLNSNHLDMKLWSAILERREREYAEMYAYLQSETCLMQYITSRSEIRHRKSATSVRPARRINRSSAPNICTLSNKRQHT